MNESVLKDNGSIETGMPQRMWQIVKELFALGRSFESQSGKFRQIVSAWATTSISDPKERSRRLAFNLGAAAALAESIAETEDKIMAHLEHLNLRSTEYALNVERELWRKVKKAYRRQTMANVRAAKRKALLAVVLSAVSISLLCISLLARFR